MKVSCKAVHAYIKYIVENGDDPRAFFEDLGYDYSLMSDEKKYMSWKDYQLITETLNKRYADFIMGMTNHGLTNKFSKQILDVLSKMISFKTVGDFILKYGFKTYYTDAVRPELVSTGRATFDILLTFDSEDDIFPVFTEMYKQVFLAIPKLISKSLTWQVDVSQKGNVLKFHVVEHRGRGSLTMLVQDSALKIFRLDRYYQNLLIRNLQNNNELERKNLELEEAEHKISKAHKEVLLVNRILTHDIANKMNIPMVVKVLIENGELEKANEKLEMFYNSVLGIIDNTRVLVDENAGSFTLSKVNLKEILNDLVYEYQDQANEKGVKILVEFEADENQDIDTNKTALKDNVLGNILHNAIKFSKKGSDVKLRIFADNGAIHISFEDTGTGMDAELLSNINTSEENLFASKLGTCGEKGHGLGLFIIRKVCSELGFTPKVESVIGKGTTFTLSKVL